MVPEPQRAHKYILHTPIKELTTIIMRVIGEMESKQQQFSNARTLVPTARVQSTVHVVILPPCPGSTADSSRLSNLTNLTM